MFSTRSTSSNTSGKPESAYFDKRRLNKRDTRQKDVVRYLCDTHFQSRRPMVNSECAVQQLEKRRESNRHHADTTRRNGLVLGISLPPASVSV